MKLPPLLYVSNRRLMGNGPELIDTLKAALWDLPPQSILVYVREPDLEGMALTELCRAFLPVVRDASQRIVVRERIDVARFVGADGVHLPEHSFTPAEVRSLWPAAWIGKTVHSVQAAKAVTDVDYAILSPIFPTESHPNATPLGLDALREACSGPVPIYALGGIDGSNAESVFAAGANGVAMMRHAWRKHSPV